MVFSTTISAVQKCSQIKGLLNKTSVQCQVLLCEVGKIFQNNYSVEYFCCQFSQYTSDDISDFEYIHYLKNPHDLSSTNSINKYFDQDDFLRLENIKPLVNVCY